MANSEFSLIVFFASIGSAMVDLLLGNNLSDN